MKNTFKFFSLKVGTVFAVSFLIVTASALALAPRKISVTKADNCTQTFGTTPIFNPYPINNSGNADDCTDASFIRARLLDSNGSPVGSSFFQTGDVTAQPGQQVQVVLYVHNGAVENGGQSATNEYVKAVVDLTQNTSHWVSAEVGASNAANGLGGSFTIQTPSNSSMQVVSGSQVWYGGDGIAGHNATQQGSLNFVNSQASLPDQQACFGWYRLIYFTVEVKAAATVTTPTTGSIHASLNSNVCPATINVRWTTEQASSVAAYNNTTGRMISGEWNNNITDSDVTPGQTYSYSIWNVDWNQTPPTKLSQIGVNSESLQVPINDCNPKPPTICSPHDSGTINIGNVFNVRVSGGDGNYRVTANDGTNFSFGGSGTNIYSGTFNTPGSKTVTVTSAGTSDTCNVQVSQVAATPTIDSFTVGNFQCPSNATIKWSTSNANSVRVYVKTNNDIEQDFANLASGNQTVDWVKPGSTYKFTIYADNIIQSQTISPAANACPTTPVCIAPTSGTITAPASVSPNQNFNLSCDFGSASDFIPAPSGCVFTNRNGSAANFSCTAPASGSATYTCQAQNQTGFTNFCSLPSAVSKTVSVTQTPINGVCGSANNTTLSSAPSGSALCNSGAASQVTGGGPWNWSCTGSNNGSTASCSASKSASATFTATAEADATATCPDGTSAHAHASATGVSSVSPQDAQNNARDLARANAQAQASVNCPAPAQQLVCTLNSPSTVGGSATAPSDLVSYSVSGGSGIYTWSANSATPFAGTGNSFSTRFNQNITIGNVSVSGTVNGQNQTVNCPPVSINIPIQPATLSCFSSPTSVQTGQQTVFTALGGNGSFVWSTTNQTSATQSGNSYNVVYGSVGTQTATVTSGTQTKTCTVEVTVQPQICTLNTNPTLTNSIPTLSGSVYSSVISWTSGNSHQIRVTRINQGSSAELAFGSGSNNGQQTVSDLQPNSTTSFKMYDAICNQPLATISITTAQIADNGGSINTCINNSCNTTNTTTTNTTTNTNINTNTNTYYYYANSVTPVPQNDYRQLSIQKQVRNINGGSFQKTISANNGDTAQFQITVTNTGNQPVNNVVLTDGNVSGLQWLVGTTQISGGANNNYYNNNWSGNNLNLGTMFTGQSITVTFQARITAANSASIQNVASVYGDSVPSRQDDAWVFVNSGSVLGGNVSLTYSKRANNDTKNINATAAPASREDFITYTLTVSNNGNTPATNFVITDDLSQVLPYADMADNGGGSLSGNVISFPGLTVPAGGSVQKSFRVRVKFSLADNLSYTMANTYGNTINININTPRVLGAFIAPKTGAETNAFVFSGILTAAFALARKRKVLLAAIGF